MKYFILKLNVNDLLIKKNECEKCLNKELKLKIFIEDRY